MFQSEEVLKDDIDIPDVTETIKVPISQKVQDEIKPLMRDFAVQTTLYVAPVSEDTQPKKVPSRKLSPTMSQTRSPVQTPLPQNKNLFRDFDLNMDDVRYEEQSIGINMMTGTIPSEIREQSMKCSNYLNTQLKRIVEAMYIFIFNAKMLVEREVKQMTVANDRLLTKLTNAEQDAIKDQILRPPEAGATIHKALQYIIDNLDTMAVKVRSYVSGMGDGVIRTMEDIFSIFHAGLFIQNGQYELIYTLVQENYDFFTYEAALDDQIFLTEVKSERAESPETFQFDIPSLEAHFDPVRIQEKHSQVNCFVVLYICFKPLALQFVIYDICRFMEGS